ncbi:hypothetical protein RUM43_010842 [Polyplax serrata]|uniref:Uncharacterized protein n=1 Tax=Polyplax serrata TaxID=468196 RepID=A0AAN8RZI2_POLSC
MIGQLILVFSAFSRVESKPRIDNDFVDNENLIEYHYRYAVDDSKSKGPVMDRWEQRIGEYVKGAYSVVEPDGRVRTVDYEVDGKKGYHAVIRMNEPSPDLLSFQQLTKSIELYPEPVPPAQIQMPSRNLSPPDPSTGKAWNYHSDTRYVNQPVKKTDQTALETPFGPKTPRTPRILENLPLSPANFNVPQTTNVIYYKTPAASIFQRTYHNSKPEIFPLRDIKKEVLVSNEPPARTRRHSTLVKRYKSFAEVLS